jgi:DNA adenine methylase
MQYLGGKSKIRKEVSTFLESVRKHNQVYFEPFTGGGWILQEMKGERIASDGNKALVSMYKALQEGWIPPEFVSEDEYKLVVKAGDTTDPLTAFVGFGCSFAGKWNGGYARSTDKVCYAATSYRSLMKQLPAIEDVTFVQGLYNEHVPEDMLVYCDPPYADTTQYGAFDGFDTDLFWTTMREWVSQGNTVVVSEYKAPDDFICVKEMKSRMGLSTTKDKNRVVRTERLFMHKSQVKAVTPVVLSNNVTSVDLISKEDELIEV